MCPVEALEDEAKGGTSSQLVLGRVSVDRSMCWAQLVSVLTHAFTSHLQILCGDCQTAREEVQRPPLGLGPASIAFILIGEETRIYLSLSYSSVSCFSLLLPFFLLCPMLSFFNQTSTELSFLLFPLPFFLPSTSFPPPSVLITSVLCPVDRKDS